MNKFQFCEIFKDEITKQRNKTITHTANENRKMLTFLEFGENFNIESVSKHFNNSRLGRILPLAKLLNSKAHI